MEDGQTMLSGSYLAPVYPEAPIFADPTEDLKKIGVPESQIKLPVRFEFPASKPVKVTNRQKKNTSSKQTLSGAQRE